MEKSEVVSANKKNVLVGKCLNYMGSTYFAKHDFKKGETVFRTFGKRIKHQTKKISVQMGLGKHFLPTKWTGRNMNHSCGPNCHVSTRKDGFPNLVAIKNIKKGDEINYSYFMTENAWAKNSAENSLKCRCRSKDCKGNIKSFEQLSLRAKKKLKKNNHISNYLQNNHS